MAEQQKSNNAYESPELLEFGNVEDLTFGPSVSNTPDAHGIQYDGSTVPAGEER